MKIKRFSCFLTAISFIFCLHVAAEISDEYGLKLNMKHSSSSSSSSSCSCSHNKRIKEYDYIIIGDGTAGAVLAKNLSDNHKNTVLVLEWGQNRTKDPVVLSPDVFQFSNLLTYDPRYAVNNIVPVRFPSHPQEQHFIYSDGRMWGGSSAHNGLFAVRGTPKIYNEWAFITGNPRWTYDNLLQTMKNLESYHPDDTLPNLNQRGLSGPVHITQSPPLDQSNPFDLALSNGTDAPFISDYNDPDEGNVGFSAHQQYITPGPNSVRSFSANAFQPIGVVVNNRGHGLNGRKLLIKSNALVSRVLFDDNKAIGVEYWFDGNKQKVRQVFAKKKIILCAGSIFTTAILERSGIGDKKRLQNLGIDVVVHNKNVGEHLINHYGPSALIEGTTSGVPFLHGYIDAEPFMPNDGDRRLQVIGLNIPGGLVSISGTIMQSKSRGSVHIVSKNPTIYPIVDLNMFSDGSVSTPGTDAYLAVSYYKIMKNIYGPLVISPPGAVYAGGDDALLAFAQDLSHLSVTYHIVGTNRMGTSVHNGVVDGDLHVIGVKHLMIADASVEPQIEDGNTAWSAYVIGQTASDIILGKN